MGFRPNINNKYYIKSEGNWISNPRDISILKIKEDLEIKNDLSSGERSFILLKWQNAAISKINLILSAEKICTLTMIGVSILS